MSECKHRRKDGVCLQDLEYVYKGFCVDGPCSCFEPQTNADRIRGMTDEELAHFMTPENYKFPCPPNHNDCQYELIPCWMCWARWIKAPVEEVDNGN